MNLKNELEVVINFKLNFYFWKFCVFILKFQGEHKWEMLYLFI